jgi:hypothetical protein
MIGVERLRVQQRQSVSQQLGILRVHLAGFRPQAAGDQHTGATVQNCFQVLRSNSLLLGDRGALGRHRQDEVYLVAGIKEGLGNGEVGIIQHTHVEEVLAVFGDSSARQPPRFVELLHRLRGP